LGKDDITDLLAVSFSSPDYIGHQYGTHAMETQDCYLRLDQDIAELITQVEAYAGKEHVLFFLTADHAAIPNPLFLNDRKIPAGLFNIAALTDTLKKHLAWMYKAPDWVLAVENDQVYLDRQAIREANSDPDAVAQAVARFLMERPGIVAALTTNDLSKHEYTWGPRAYLQKGFYPKRSGDVAFILAPGLIEYKPKGTTHGSGYTYDTHVPLIFYGAGILPGRSVTHIDITDIAPTLSQILGIQPPNGCTGKVITDLFR
jgi:predicted AlkP superfamily pyrophosphatase or phosphodiesterase